MSRIFGRKAVQMVKEGADKCAAGLAETNSAEDLSGAEEFLAQLRERFPAHLTAGLWNDMNLVGDKLNDLA
jgi:hypothetical protein